MSPSSWESQPEAMPHSAQRDSTGTAVGAKRRGRGGTCRGTAEAPPPLGPDGPGGRISGSGTSAAPRLRREDGPDGCKCGPRWRVSGSRMTRGRHVKCELQLCRLWPHLSGNGQEGVKTLTLETPSGEPRAAAEGQAASPRLLRGAGKEALRPCRVSEAGAARPLPSRGVGLGPVGDAALDGILAWVCGAAARSVLGVTVRGSRPQATRRSERSSRRPA